MFSRRGKGEPAASLAGPEVEVGWVLLPWAKRRCRNLGDFLGSKLLGL